MKVLRKQEIETENVKVGDQIEFTLSGLGNFTATAQQITEKGVLFMFDNCVKESEMSCALYKWMSSDLKNAFPDDIRKNIVEITLPTFGQMFGHTDWYYKNSEPDTDEQLPLMKTRKNRIADYNGDYAWYWLKNATDDRGVFCETYNYVSSDGDVYWEKASYAFGVRPVFLIC